MLDPPRLRNRRGEPIDPVPFIVTAGVGFALIFSFGPIYGLAYGLSLPAALGASALGFGGVALVAHRQLVRSAPPADAGPLPADVRFERLLYAGIALGAAFLALTLPLL
ncbi:hypothetical protein C463_13819 [Halorubrum californiense DSM 19288]|uniref:Uncharacterized protein n=1 Tax=Halorubrum californiense DSM 19288 TaxID=1227465 RepID=M0E305_9EURY|nr:MULTISPECIES: hypothetical protein [Halorubrum]ELZ41327.1 hypothetical protein C463_13819 [Halorubrum californiense DSM 19288]TKX67516.1 hypothetical protein EXE40_14945 [Halorubrum sp. GN11GM_10-3_MGM]